MNRGISNDEFEFNPIVISSHDDLIKEAMKIMGETGKAIVCIGSSIVCCEATMQKMMRDLDTKVISIDELKKENKSYPEYGWYRKFDKRKFR